MECFQVFLNSCYIQVSGITSIEWISPENYFSGVRSFQGTARAKHSIVNAFWLCAPSTELSGSEGDIHTIVEVIDDLEMIIAVSKIPGLSTAIARSAQRCFIHDPTANIYCMNILLGDDISRKGTIQTPCTESVFGI